MRIGVFAAGCDSGHSARRLVESGRKMSSSYATVRAFAVLVVWAWILIVVVPENATDPLGPGGNRNVPMSNPWMKWVVVPLPALGGTLTQSPYWVCRRR